MNQFAAIPLSWMWLFGAAVAFVVGMLLLKKGRHERKHDSDESYTDVGRLLMLLGVLPLMTGLFVWDSEAKVGAYIKNDPEFSEMAVTAEAITWMDREVEPAVQEFQEANREMERKKAAYDAAKARLEKALATLESKKQEFEKRFGHLTEGPPTAD